MTRVFRSLVVALVFAIFAGPSIAQQPTPEQAEAIHNELRALRDRAVAAIKDRKPDVLFNELTEDVAFTAMDNVPVHGKAEAKAYYDKMMSGASSIVQDMSITIEPDVLSALHNNGQSAISTGNSTAYFKLRGGLEFTAPLRWTAALVNDGAGWKVASAHFSANMFDSPIDTGIRKYLYLMLGAAGLVGLVIGFIFGRSRRRA